MGKENLRFSELVSLVALFTMRTAERKGADWVDAREKRDEYMAELDARVEAMGTKKKLAFDAASIPLPEFIPRAAWANWCADRKERRKPITERGAHSQIKELARLKVVEGHEAEDVIAHSIAGGYQGLFAPKASASSEPAWRKEQRERTQIAAPGVASQGRAADFFTIDAEPVRQIR